MPNNDSRYYARIAKSIYLGMDYPQALLDIHPIIKGEDEQGDPTYYTEADDGLKVYEALDLLGQRIDFYSESDGVERVATIEEADVVLIGQHAPSIEEFMIFGQLAIANQWEPKDAMLRWGAELLNYTENGILPSQA
jgi:hypothetical protein